MNILKKLKSKKTNDDDGQLMIHFDDDEDGDLSMGLRVKKKMKKARWVGKRDSDFFIKNFTTR